LASEIRYAFLSRNNISINDYILTKNKKHPIFQKNLDLELTSRCIIIFRDMKKKC